MADRTPSCPAKRRTHPPLRPLTEEERETVLRHIGLVRRRVWRMGWAMAYREVRSAISRQRIACQFMDEFYGWCCIGLCIAVQRFKPGGRGTFGTYAFGWVRAYSSRAASVAEVKIGSLKDRENIGVRALDREELPKLGHRACGRGCSCGGNGGR